ncbi:hypothetical protein Trydic_g10141 [Trypoxylus dichotomus]
MFATKLLLKYAVKPVSPPRNVMPQETIRTFTHLPYDRNYSSAYMSRHVSRSSTADCDAIKTTRLQEHSKLCARSEPKPFNPKKWTDLDQSIVNHPNFEKAAALVQMLDDVSLQKPHRIGSLPSGKFNSNAKTIKAAVNIVKNVVEGKEVEGEAGLHKEDEQVEINSRGDIRTAKQTKPYVINIYLETKQTRTARDDDIKRKIKEFWDEQMFQNVSMSTAAKRITDEIPSDEEDPYDFSEEDERQPVRNERGFPQKSRQLAVHVEEPEDRETLGEIPRYRTEHIKKIYPDTTSTANPHTERLLAGTPPSYDLHKRIKDVISSASPVNTSGFSKYLTFWKQMWNKKQEAKEAQAIEKDDQEHSVYPSENPEDEQAKQPFKLIENDNIFTTKEKRYNPYDPIKNQEEDSDEVTKESIFLDETPDVEKTKSKRRYTSKRRYYSTVSNPKALNGFGPDESLRARSRAATRLQIMEFQNFEDQILNYPQKMDYSTTYKKYGYFKSDPNNESGASSKLQKESPKTNQTRVQDFVDKFKNALSADNRPEFKKINVVYGAKGRNPCASAGASQRQVKVKISKLTDSKSECQLNQNRDGGDPRRTGNKFDRKSNTAKKK